MPARNFESEFKEIMVQEAARDKYVRGTFEWLLLGETNLVSENFIDQVDESELAADIGKDYALGPEEVKRAFEICEAQIEQETNHG